MQEIEAACDGQYRAAHDSGPRKAADIKWVVIHSTEGHTAENAAAYFASEEAKGSANLVVDDDICFRTVPDLRVPWAAPPLNHDGFHIELAGFAHWTQDEWLRHSWTIRRAAYKTAHRCHVYNIPVRKVGWLGLKLGRAGITDHASVSKAFHVSDHTDPGPNFPWPYFIDLVKAYSKYDFFRPGL